MGLYCVIVVVFHSSVGFFFVVCVVLCCVVLCTVSCEFVAESFVFKGPAKEGYCKLAEAINAAL